LIVQCEHCQTKYRIADEKVKGKGVKVRCAKCENVFTVTPPENDIQAPTPAPTSPPETEEGPVPSHANSVFDGPEQPTPEASSPALAGPEPPAPPSQEKPASGNGGGVIEGPPGFSPLPPLDDFQDPPFPEEEQPSVETTPANQGAGGSHVPPLFGEEGMDSGAQRPAHEMDHTGLASPPPSETEQPEDGGFEIEGTMREESLPGSDPFGDETDEGIAASPQDPDAQWGNIAINEQALPDLPGGDFGLADSSGYEPPPPVPMEEAEEQAPPDHLDDPTSGTSTVPAYQPETRTSRGGKKGLVFLLLLAALGGGGYYAYPTVMEMIQSRGQQTEGTLTPTNIKVKSLSRDDGKILYVVRGEVRNESTVNVGIIQVEAQFRDASGSVLSKATSYCGNLFEDSELGSLDLKKIRSDLQNELGQSLSNRSIAPGQAVPFLVVLENPPSGISEVTVTIPSHKETT